MLHQLAEFAHAAFPELEPGFGPALLKWRINLPRDMSAVWTIEPFGEEGFLHSAVPEYPANLMQGGGKCHFLIDELRTSVLLIDKKDDAKKYKAKHDFFVELLRSASSCHPDLSLLTDWLTKPEVLEEIRKWLHSRGAVSADRAVFLIGGTDLSRSDECKQWWREYRYALVASESSKAKRMMCFMSGEEIVPAKTHDKVSGLKRFGGRGQDIVVGYDKAAFTSYGLDQNENAAMSEHMAKAYVQGLDYLIEHQRRDIGNAAAVYWFNRLLKIPSVICA
jgi:hypothetical protein